MIEKGKYMGERVSLKPNELRIGNWIYDDSGVLSKVIGFQPFGHSVRCDEAEGCDLLIDIYSPDGTIRKGYEVDINGTTPVLLTEEWLIKAGCTEHSQRIFYLPGSSLTICKGNAGWYLPYISNPIKFVHTFQNAVFAMTSQELEFNHIKE